MVQSAIESFLNTKLNVYLYLIDNSPTDELRSIADNPRVEYIHNPSNPGFGIAHNIAIKKITERSNYHLVLNPDIFFNAGVIEALLQYMDEHKDTGVIMPKILYPNGEVQYLAKLLPTPMDFVIRRFIPFNAIKTKYSFNFEMRGSNYNQTLEIPYLSGCFLIFRTSVLKNINGFDEKIFMHMEDVDICRRVIDSGYRSVFFPHELVFHDHEKKSFSNLKTLKIYLKSAIYYFNKWGWFFDKKRVVTNKKTRSQINVS